MRYKFKERVDVSLVTRCLHELCTFQGHTRVEDLLCSAPSKLMQPTIPEEHTGVEDFLCSAPSLTKAANHIRAHRG